MKRFILAQMLIALTATAAMAQVVIGGSEYQVDTLFMRQLGPGINNTIIRIPGYPLNVYLLEADMNNPYNRIETMQGQGTVGKTELLTNAAQRYSTPSKRVLAGCNANFWCVSGQGTSSIYMLGSPYGAVVRNDTIYTNTLIVYDNSRSRLRDIAAEWVEDTPVAKFIRHNLSPRKAVLIASR